MKKSSGKLSNADEIEELNRQTDQILATRERDAMIADLNHKSDTIEAYRKSPLWLSKDEIDRMKEDASILTSSVFKRKYGPSKSVSAEQPPEDRFLLYIHDLRMSPDQLEIIVSHFSGKTDCIKLIMSPDDPLLFSKIGGGEHERFAMDAEDVVRVSETLGLRPDFVESLRALGKLSEHHAVNC